MKKSKFCILFVLFVIAANIAAVDAQIVLKGKVTTREEEPVAFAAVSLRGMRDTTRLVETAVTDMQGNYAFGKHREGKYLLTIQSLGFRTLNDTVHIRRSSLGNTYEMRKDYLLEEEATAIDDVVVVGTNVTHYLDRTVYRVTNADRRTAVTGLDLTNKVPQVTLDRINETVSSSDGAVTILVNGIAASAQELKTISPEEVGQIEYYDLPPIRYGGGNAVLNIVTQEVRDGFYGGIDLKHAVPVRWLNDSFYLRYNRGRSQLTFRYYASWHKSDAQFVDDEYRYALNGTDYAQYLHTSGGYRSFYNDFNLKYTNQLQDKYVFQATFYPSLRNNENHYDSQIEFLEGATGMQRYGNYRTESKIFNPTLDLYFWRQLGRKQELIMAITGNYFDSGLDTRSSEYDSADDRPVFEDFLTVDGRKYSAIGQALYIKNFEKVAFSVGERFSYESNIAHTTSWLSGDRQERTTRMNNYLAAEVSGKIKTRFSYRFSLGVIASRTVTAGNDSWQWVFAPNVIAGYQISSSFIVKAGFSQANTSPSIGMLDDRIAMITQNIVSRGNPSLKNGFRNSAFIGTGYTNKWLNINVTCLYGYAKNPINYYYRQDGARYEYMPVNDKSSETCGINYALQLTPFENDILTIKLQGGVYYTNLNSGVLGRVGYLRIPLSYYIQFAWKNLSAFYQGNIVTGNMVPPMIVYSDLGSGIGIIYKYRNFAFSLSCANFLIRPESRSHTIDGSAVWRKSTGSQRDSYNRVMLGVSYNFGRGRVYNEAERHISNRDEDSGL
ncbi:MAG: TonB-dependent receptor [Tidjanibacter sp.]|nr:TonB-dependent receptor [Tidjanibacter sp.]